jgi:hypothetical protein
MQHSIRFSFSLITFSLICLFALPACKKAGPGGKAKVYGVVAHHGAAIPGAVVYIKYGATESPGTSIALYDNNFTCSADGSYSIGSLAKGNYFLYAVGYDLNALGNTEKVTGGIAVVLGRKDSKQQDIAVTE